MSPKMNLKNELLFIYIFHRAALAESIYMFWTHPLFVSDCQITGNIIQVIYLHNCTMHYPNVFEVYGKVNCYIIRQHINKLSFWQRSSYTEWSHVFKSVKYFVNSLYWHLNCQHGIVIYCCYIWIHIFNDSFDQSIVIKIHYHFIYQNVN